MADQTAPKRRRWPKLPTVVQGTGGPITVRITEAPGGPEGTAMGFLFGIFDAAERTIDIRKGLTGDVQWMTLYHELCHASLWDSGLHNLFSKKKIESLCDAIGTARFRERFG